MTDDIVSAGLCGGTPGYAYSRHGSGKRSTVYADDCGNYDCKTGCLGAFICTCIRTACRRRCPLFNDSFRNYDVVLQGCPLYLSCKSIWHGTNGSLDWYVRRLVYPLRNLFGQIFKRPVAEKSDELIEKCLRK